MEEFFAVETYKELLEVNKKFIRGEIEETPYHFGPLEADSQTLKDDLLALHDKDIFTVNGQAGAAGTSYDEWSDYAQGYVDQKQAPYLSFYIEKSKGEKLKEKLDEDILIKYTFFVKENPIYSNYNGKFAVTMERSAKTINELKNTPWKDYTVLSSQGYGSYYETEISLIDDSDDYYYTEVFIPKHGTKKSLEKRILKML
jgi:hypothetical protein